MAPRACGGRSSNSASSNDMGVDALVKVKGKGKNTAKGGGKTGQTGKDNSKSGKAATTAQNNARGETSHFGYCG